MTSHQTWFITGAGRGLGADIARAALAAGHDVVATGRDGARVARELGESDRLLVAALDVTRSADADAAVAAAVDRFGSIDVLVNNAGSFCAGFFEELAPEQVERQLATTLLGPMHVTRAVLPVMRGQRGGHVISISSLGALIGVAYGSAYCAAKFGLDGFMESLAGEVEPFGIHTTIVNPGFFRTGLLTPRSTSYATPSIEDYAAANAGQRMFWAGANGAQEGDPALLARALVTLAAHERPPRRFVAGNDAVETALQVAATLQREVDAHRALSTSLAFAGA